MKFTKNRVVCVKWMDASSNHNFESGWNEKSPTEGLIEVTTVGVLVDRDVDAVIIAFNTNSIGTQNDWMTIPKKWIKDIKYISNREFLFPVVCSSCC